MNYPASVMKNAHRRMEETKEKNKKIAEERKRKAYEKIPELYRFNSDIARLVRLTAEGGGKISELKREAKEIFAKRKKLLYDNGFDESVLDGVFDCPICRDEGFVNGEICQCYRQIICEEAYKLSNLEEKIKKQNFDTFDINVFSNREEMKKIYTYAVNYCRQAENVKKNLIFSGKQGTGKTFLSSCIAKYFLDSKKSVLYLTAQKLCNMLDDKRFNKETNYNVNDYYDFILECDLLIIDDLGVEFAGVTSQPMLFDVLETRISKGKRNVISTNLGMDELAKKYSLRFTSRLFEDYQIFIFNGEDLRLKLSQM